MWTILIAFDRIAGGAGIGGETPPQQHSRGTGTAQAEVRAAVGVRTGRAGIRYGYSQSGTLQPVLLVESHPHPGGRGVAAAPVAATSGCGADRGRPADDGFLRLDRQRVPAVSEDLVGASGGRLGRSGGAAAVAVCHSAPRAAAFDNSKNNCRKPSICCAAL